MKYRRGIFLAAGMALLAAAGIFTYIRGQEKGEIRQFSAFIAVPGETLSAPNRIQEKLAELTGARAEVEWLDGQTAAEKVESMIVAEDYPDLLQGGDGTAALVEAGALIPLDDYLDDYEHLKNYLTEEQWDSLRREDGHIYYIPSFGVNRGKDTKNRAPGEPFWVQKRVLEWANYPELHTLDEYFDLLAAYVEANPTTGDLPTIGFEILCDDWRWFCLENPPMFLAGYPNDGCAIVDPKTQKASVYDTIPEAKQYYQKLCEMYHRGVVDPETFTLSFSQYLGKLKQGNVLGFVDQYWQIMTAQNYLYANGMEEYTYVPFPITASEEIEGNYNRTENSLNVAEGMGISVSCRDVEGALAFLDGILSEEAMVLRGWGEEGIDYCVDDQGVFYRTEEQRAHAANDDYLKTNFCGYAFFPAYEGMLADGINTILPYEQPGEYYATLSAYDQKILDAYGHQTWKDFMGEEKEGEAWYPLYSCKESWGEDTPYGQANEDMQRVKREWLPRVIMTDPKQFEQTWSDYMTAYHSEVDVEAYETQLNLEIQKRIAAKEKYQ